MEISIAITKNNGFELDWNKELGFVEDFFTEYNIPIKIYSEFFDSELLLPMEKGTKYIDPVFLDMNVHRHHLSKFNYSCFTLDRREYLSLPGASLTLRGWQSFPNMPIGELVVTGEDGKFVYEKNGKIRTTDKERVAKKGRWYLSQWSYTFIHELFHAIEDQLRLENKLHEYINAGKFTLYAKKHLGLAKNDDDEDVLTAKTQYSIEPLVIRHLDNSWSGNVPESIVLHTLLGSIEGSYSWLDHVNLAYNYMIDTDGTIYEQNHWSRSAWHAGVVSGPQKKVVDFYKGQNPNRRSVGISFARKGEPELTKEQASSAVRLIKWLGQQTGYHYDENNIFTHHDITLYKPKEVLGYRETVLSLLKGERGPVVESSNNNQAILALLLKVLKYYMSK